MSYWEIAARLAEEQGAECNSEAGYFFCPHCNKPIFKWDWTDAEMFEDKSVICPICNELLGDSYAIEDIAERQ